MPQPVEGPVDRGEWAAPDKTAMRRERRRMNTFEDHVLRSLDEASLFPSGRAPEYEDDGALARRQRLDHGVGERLPASFLVTVGLSRPHGEHGVEQEHALSSPTRQVTA